MDTNIRFASQPSRQRHRLIDVTGIAKLEERLEPKTSSTVFQSAWGYADLAAAQFPIAGACSTMMVLLRRIRLFWIRADRARQSTIGLLVFASLQ